MTDIHVSWKTFDIMFNNLVKEIEKTEIKFDGIYAIPRGGLVFGVCLSHRLNLPLLLHPTKDTLICDDISDTGDTLYQYRKKFIVTLFSTKWTTAIPNIWYEEKVSRDDWIVFPWEEK